MKQKIRNFGEFRTLKSEEQQFRAIDAFACDTVAGLNGIEEQNAEKQWKLLGTDGQKEALLLDALVMQVTYSGLCTDEERCMKSVIFMLDSPYAGEELDALFRNRKRAVPSAAEKYHVFKATTDAENAGRIISGLARKLAASEGRAGIRSKFRKGAFK